MKRKTWRKNIAILLVIAMMMTIMPVAAFAVDGEPEVTNTDPTPAPVVTTEPTQNLEEESNPPGSTEEEMLAALEAAGQQLPAPQNEIGEDKTATLAIPVVQFVDSEGTVVTEIGATAGETINATAQVVMKNENGEVIKDENGEDVVSEEGITVTTSDATVVAVGEGNALTAVAAGEAIVTATFENTSAELAVTVEAADTKDDNDKSSSGTTAGDVPGTKEIDWKVSQSKTTEKSVLKAEDSYKTNVTLSLPAKNEKLQSAVVFILDNSDSAKAGAEECLESLRTELKNVSEEASVKVAVVKFKSKAISGGWHDLNDKSAIDADIDAKISTGTNIHAGLLEAQRLLGMEEVKDIPKERTYVILVSDGVTYLFSDATGEPFTIGTSVYSLGDANNSVYPYQIEYSSECMNLKWGKYNIGFSEMVGNDDQDASKAVEAYLAQLKVNEEFFVPFTGAYNKKISTEEDFASTNNTILHFRSDASEEYIQSGLATLNEKGYMYALEKKDVANNMDVAFLKAAQAWGSLCETDKNGESYNCYAVKCPCNYAYGPDFMNYLSGVAGTSNTIDFTEISNDIAYVIERGIVTDYMGYGTDDHGNNYNFDFVDPENMILTVGKETYTATTISELQWGFKPNDNGFDYVVEYVPGDKGEEEYFEWTINVPVSEFVPVSLTYTVQLMNPQTSVATTTTFKNLLTNRVTTLDYTGYSGDGKVEFKVEPVEYTVTSGGGGGGNDPFIPQRNDDTPSVTQIPDPVVPQAEPEIIPEEDVPMVDVPGEEVIEAQLVPQAELPADVAKTGDSSTPMAFAMVLLAAGLGLVLTRRKFN